MTHPKEPPRGQAERPRMDRPSTSREDAARRRQAEAMMGLAPPAADEAARLLHELRVHQIELRLQNDELRSARGELEAALARYTGLFDFAPIGYLVVDRQGAIVQLNLAGAALFEKPRAELIGRRLGALLPDASRRMLTDCLTRVFAGGEPPLRDLALAKAATPRTAQLEARLDPSGQTCLLVLLDITERQRIEAELRVAASVYENLNEGVLITDADNRIVAVNPAFTGLTGYTEAEAVGQTPSLLRSGRQDAAFYSVLWQSVLGTGQWQGELVNRRKSGAEFTERLSIHTIYDARGQVLRRIGVFSDITEQRRMADSLWRQANFDGLTGLANRRFAQERLEQDIDRMERAGRQLALLFIDLDQFKTINDTLGHAVGDQLLIEAGQRLLACVRRTDFVARTGGDEFIVIMADLTNPGRVDFVAQAIIDALARSFPHGDRTLIVTASVGITLYPDDGVSAAALMMQADQAMYAAKAQGGNRFQYFTASMQEAALARLQLIFELRQALVAHQFEVYFQPIVDLRTGAIVKAEALVRWHHPTRGLIGPNDFIGVAEQCGMIHELGEWVFHVAAEWVLQRQTQGGAPFQVSVNKSPAQFVGGQAREAWPAWLKSRGQSADTVVVEVTEGLLLSDRAEILDQLRQLRVAGIGLAIDDFGTGYSALAYLKKFHADYLKIDISFIRDLETDPEDRALCDAIIVVAHKLGAKVIAEGVETAWQRDWLLAAGCDYAQGYLFGRPLPAKEIDW